MKIDIMILILNGQPFIEYNLRQHYWFANKIWIIEGADNRTRDHVDHKFFTDSGHSTDKTVEIINSFPDPEHKITLIQHPNNTFWSNGKDEMIAQINNKIEGDFIFEIDVDEFYKREDIEKLINIIKEYPQITSFGIPWRNFWHNFHTIYGLETADTFKVEWGFWGWRLFKWLKNESNWNGHRPPNVSYHKNQYTKDGRLYNTSNDGVAWGPAHLAPRDIYTYHYSDLLPKQNLMKSQYYEIPQWYENIFMKWLTHKEEVEAYGIYPLGGSGKTMEYDGTHPSEIYRLAKELKMEIK